MTHPDHQLRILALDESETKLNWNVGVGMVRPDQNLRDAIDAALERLRADGTVDDLKQRLAIKNLFVPGGVSDNFRVLIQRR